jgi:hypothetical protein
MPQFFDIFNNRPFQAVEITGAIELVEYQPTLLGTLGENLFRTVRSRFRQVAISKRSHQMRLVPVSPIGAPPVQLERTGGDMRSFQTKRLAKATTVYAEELSGILHMPLFDATRTTQQEVAERSGLIRDDIELTEEHMRLGAIQGKVIDADGTTVLDDWFANWGVPVPATINFHFDVETTNIRLICDDLINTVWMASKGAWIQGVSRVEALCGSEFYRSLITHPTVVATYMNYAAAADLRGDIPDSFNYGGITFHRYRSAPSGEFSIPADQARFYPVGAGDTFQRVMGPAEFDPWINQAGQDIYAMTILDRDRGAWAKVEQYNYPLYACLRPEMLQTGVAA